VVDGDDARETLQSAQSAAT